MNMSKFLYLKFKDTMDDSRNPSYIGAKSYFTQSVMSCDDRSVQLEERDGPLFSSGHFG
jgi:hypothetical protein